MINGLQKVRGEREGMVVVGLGEQTAVGAYTMLVNCCSTCCCPSVGSGDDVVVDEQVGETVAVVRLARNGEREARAGIGSVTDIDCCCCWLDNPIDGPLIMTIVF